MASLLYQICQSARGIKLALIRAQIKLHAHVFKHITP